MLDWDELRITTRSAAIKCAQSLVRRHVKERRSLVKELLRERRRKSLSSLN